MSIGDKTLGFWSRFVVVCVTFCLSNGFNIDVDKFMLLRGDGVSSGSYFGYSVAIMKNAGRRQLR